MAIDLQYSRFLQSQKQFEFDNRQFDEPIGTSYLGTPVVSNLVIPSGVYIDPQTGNQINYVGLRIDSVLFAVSRAKNIVSEIVQGANGTVNEYISLGDYNVDIAMILNGESFDRGGGNFDVNATGHRFPANDLAKYLTIFNAPAVIPVESRFLAFFGISELIFLDHNIPQSVGSWNSQKISVSAKTELDVDLEQQTIDQ